MRTDQFETCCIVILLFIGPTFSLLGEEQLRVVPSELVKHYEDYDGKRIVIEGEVASGPEMTVMYLGRASGGDDPNGMLVGLSESVSQRPTATAKRFKRMLKKKSLVHAVLEGYFSGAADRQWGHQLCCRFKLRVEKVISVR
jgi:hypothetical protein